jgi:hypothetical protein
MGNFTVDVLEIVDFGSADDNRLEPLVSVLAKGVRLY